MLSVVTWGDRMGSDGVARGVVEGSCTCGESMGSGVLEEDEDGYSEGVTSALLIS